MYCMFIGDSKTQQLMMRCRVLAQGFTIGAIAFGVFFVQFQKKNKNTNI